MVGLCRKIENKHWLKHPKAVPPKTKFRQKKKITENLILGIIFLKIFFLISSIQLFYIYPPCVHTVQWTLSEFFLDFKIFSRKSRSQQKLAKRITHFAMQFRSKNLTYFMNLNSLDIEYAPPTQLKTSVTLEIFQ